LYTLQLPYRYIYILIIVKYYNHVSFSITRKHRGHSATESNFFFTPRVDFVYLSVARYRSCVYH
jgi:hypothetical protein